MEKMMENTRAIIDYAYEDNGKEMRDALYSAINDKVMAHIETHKQQLAKNLIMPQEQESGEEVENS